MLTSIYEAAMDNLANSSCSSQKDITLFDDGYLVQLRFSDEDFIYNFRDSQECVVRANLNPPLLGDVSETGQGWLAEKSQTVYGLVQCQEDMLKGTGQDCLSSAMAKREQMVDQMGGAILGVGCSLWYQTEVQFFAGTPALSLNMPTRKFISNTAWLTFFRTIFHLPFHLTIRLELRNRGAYRKQDCQHQKDRSQICRKV
jgi:hypothetical protein